MMALIAYQRIWVYLIHFGNGWDIAHLIFPGFAQANTLLSDNGFPTCMEVKPPKSIKWALHHIEESNTIVRILVASY